MLISGARTTNQNKNFKPLFIGFGKQALEYARVLKSLNIKINSVCISNLKRNKNNLRKYEIVHIIVVLFDIVTYCLCRGN